MSNRDENHDDKDDLQMSWLEAAVAEGPNSPDSPNFDPFTACFCAKRDLISRTATAIAAAAAGDNGHNNAIHEYCASSPHPAPSTDSHDSSRGRGADSENTTENNIFNTNTSTAITTNTKTTIVANTTTTNNTIRSSSSNCSSRRSSSNISDSNISDNSSCCCNKNNSRSKMQRKAVRRLQAGGYFLLWLVFSETYKHCSVEVLKVLPDVPITIASIQHSVGLFLYVGPMWLLRIRKRPKLFAMGCSVWDLIQLVCQHACGHVSQLNWIARDMFKRSPNPYIISSLATPAMVAGCSAIDLEQIFSFPVYLSLIPVSAATSLAFWKPEKPLEVCWLWLLSVMLTLAYWSLSVTMAKRCITATRTVGSHRSTTSRRRGNNDNNNTSEATRTSDSLNKRTTTIKYHSVKSTKSEGMTPANLCAVVHCLAFILLSLGTIFEEGGKIAIEWVNAATALRTTTDNEYKDRWPGGEEDMALDVGWYILVSGLCLYAADEVTFRMLGCLHPLTFAVGTTVTRMAIATVGRVGESGQGHHVLYWIMAVGGAWVYAILKAKHDDKEAKRVQYEEALFVGMGEDGEGD